MNVYWHTKNFDDFIILCKGPYIKYVGGGGEVGGFLWGSLNILGIY